MKTVIKNGWRQAGCRRWLLAVAAIGQPASVEAAELSWSDAPFSYYAEKESLRSALESVASAQMIPVKVSDRVNGEISVNFINQPLGEVFNQLVKAYSLTWYYDGYTLYVYQLDEVQSATVKLKSLTANEFLATLKQLGIHDDRFHWRAAESGKLVYLSGPQRYVDMVTDMATVVDEEKPSSDGQVYTWVDESGTTHFSSQPPVEQVDELRRIGINTPTITEENRQYIGDPDNG